MASIPVSYGSESTSLDVGRIEFGPPATPGFRQAYEQPGIPQPIYMVGPARFMTVDAFSAISGYTGAAIRSKKAEGIWREGKEYVIAPDGRILIDVEGYNKWVQSRH